MAFANTITVLLAAAACATPAPAGHGPVGHDNGDIHACTGTAGSAPRVLCVRAGAAGGGTGTAAAPFATIQAAIDAAAAGDIVQVAAGSYAENVRLGSFASSSAKDLTLLGGFRADFAVRDAAAHPATIDGGGVDPAVQLHLDTGGTTTLDGFVVTDGRGLGTDWQDGGGHGGGVYVQRHGDGTTVITHNEIHGNRTANHASADSRGGGIHAYAQDWGGATAQVRIEDNHIHDNLAGKGAGINVTGRSATLLRNRVADNIAHADHGGGVYVSTASTEVRDNAIVSNRIGETAGYGWGGGLIVAAASADLSGNLVADNFAPTIGSGLFWDEGATGTMTNDLVVANRCTNDGRSGAAIYVDGGAGPSQVDIENVTIADHDCPGTDPGGGAVYIEGGSQADLRNAILWNNTREFGTDSGGAFSIVHSITAQAGTGNQLQDPLFADAAGGDYHLRSAGGRWTPTGWVIDALTSPAIDAGNPASPFALEPSPNGGRINLGAFGNTPQASRSAGDGIFANGFD